MTAAKKVLLGSVAQNQWRSRADTTENTAKYNSMPRNAIDSGAAGVDMGRNIFQSEAPIAMIQAVHKVVHDNMPAEQAYQYYLELKNS